ncbi:MAG: hypothetical protein HKP30_09965 [Myxococcales bacterium]|nr:hypothetical protein [Myxococcales bacterium]
MQAVFYYLGIAFLFTHELDAMTHAEWRLLFVLRDLPEGTASPWFVALHVPAFFFILWLSQHGRARVRDGTRFAVAAFLVIHAVLHAGLSSAPDYGFHGALSQVLIAGAAVFGSAYLLAWLRSRRAGGTEP